MAKLRNKQKLAAVTRKTQEENPRNGQSRNLSVPRINEEYITQVYEEIEGRVTKKLSQEFSRTESRILGALTNLDEFLSNKQIHTHIETVPGTFRNTNVENQGTNDDDSQNDPHPEASIFRGQTTQTLGPKDCPDKYQANLTVEVASSSLKILTSFHKINLCETIYIYSNPFLLFKKLIINLLKIINIHLKGIRTIQSSRIL